MTHYSTISFFLFESAAGKNYTSQIYIISGCECTQGKNKKVLQVWTLIQVS